MGGGTRGHFDRLQIESAAPAQASQDDFQKRGYLARCFLLDGCGLFFPVVTMTPRLVVRGRSFR
jgi:hypothetical protein